MNKKAAIVKYSTPFASVAEVVRLSGAFDEIRTGDTVFVKPNIVVWSRVTPIPPWGVITTTRVVEDVVRLLKDLGAGRIVIGEGVITNDPKDRETPAHAFETLGYNAIAKKYGATVVNLFDGAFRDVDAGDGVTFGLSEHLLDADLAVSLPVLKTHAQTKVSLGLKNLKGCLDIKSRKRCHSDCHKQDLDFHLAKIPGVLPKTCCVTDGIFSLERGPVYTGKARRSDILVASGNLLAADITGATALGFAPSDIPHIAKACEQAGISPSVDSLEIVGEPMENVASPHQWDFPYNEDGTLPLVMDRMGITGLSFPKYDHSLCSYCSGFVGLVQMAIMGAWKRTPFDNVEVLTGKIRRPTPGMNHTILFGKCQTKLHKDHPDIRNQISVPGCPPNIGKLAQALDRAGIEIDPKLVENFEMAPALFTGRYEKKPAFAPEFFRYSDPQ